MHKLDISQRERISTQSGAMNLDAGRATISDGVKLFLLTCGAWLVIISGLLMGAASLRAGAYEHWFVTLLRFWAGGLGAGLAGIAAFYGGAFAHLFVSEWYGYQLRRDEWHTAELIAYRRAGGQVVDRQISVKALTTAEPAHLLLVALSLAERAQRGAIKEPSAASLQGDVWLGMIKAGELTKPQSEEFGTALAQIGLITGRKKGHAGRLLTTDFAEVYQLVTTRAGRVRSLDAGSGVELAENDQNVI